MNDDKFQKLTEQVTAAGFSDVTAFVEAMADQCILFDPLTDEQLAASLAMIQRSEADIEADQPLSFRFGSLF